MNNKCSQNLNDDNLVKNNRDFSTCGNGWQTQSTNRESLREIIRIGIFGLEGFVILKL